MQHGNMISDSLDEMKRTPKVKTIGLKETAILTPQSCDYDMGWNDCLEEVKELIDDYFS